MDCDVRLLLCVAGSAEAGDADGSAASGATCGTCSGGGDALADTSNHCLLICGTRGAASPVKGGVRSLCGEAPSPAATNAAVPGRPEEETSPSETCAQDHQSCQR